MLWGCAARFSLWFFSISVWVSFKTGYLIHTIRINKNIVNVLIILLYFSAENQETTCKTTSLFKNKEKGYWYAGTRYRYNKIEIPIFQIDSFPNIELNIVMKCGIFVPSSSWLKKLPLHLFTHPPTLFHNYDKTHLKKRNHIVDLYMYWCLTCHFFKKRNTSDFLAFKYVSWFQMITLSVT